MPTQTSFARAALRGGGLTFRPPTLDDIPWVVAFQTARDPSEPANGEQIRHSWLSGDPERVDERWIVEADGGPIGYAYFGHPAWEKLPMRASRLFAWFSRDPSRPERLRRALDVLEPYAAADGTKVFTTGTMEGFDDELLALLAHGYKEGRRSKSWELDLDAKGATTEAMTAASRERMGDECIEITTIDRIADPEKWRKLHAMCEASIQDIPTTVPRAPESLESFMKWMSSPGMHADRLWVAREGTAIVGMSVLEYPRESGTSGPTTPGRPARSAGAVSRAPSSARPSCRRSRSA